MPNAAWKSLEFLCGGVHLWTFKTAAEPYFPPGGSGAGMVVLEAALRSNLVPLLTNVHRVLLEHIGPFLGGRTVVARGRHPV